MPRDSLKQLLDMFPYFFTRGSDSNFVRSQDVTNRRFQDLYNSLRDTYESFSLRKKCLIYKEQSEDYDYTMHFLTNIPLLENVKVFEGEHCIYEAIFSLSDDESYSYCVVEYAYTYTYNDEEGYIIHDIYTREHTIEENITTIDYSYTSTSENLIPDIQYSITVKTFDEYSTSKGFPENDEILGDIYDHDISLDEIGALHNIPRKKYISSMNYSRTEPPWNNRGTEDDYHYMQRILQYVLLLHSAPLPVAEIFKLYGLDAELLNRDRFLVRMFDIYKHDYYIDKTSEGDQTFVGDWIPEPWEHKDRFCVGGIDLGEYFYVSANTLRPVRKQKVYFYLEFLNCLLEALTGDYSVNIYLNGTLIEEGFTGSTYKVDLSLLDNEHYNVFYFEGYNGGRLVGTWESVVHVRGCDDADFYVSSNGSDSNDGKSWSTSFATIEKAVESVNGIYNLIAIRGTIETGGSIPVPSDTIIIGCGNAEVTNTESHVFFQVARDKYLILQDFTVSTENEPFTGWLDNEVFTNDNQMDEVETVLCYSMDNGVLIDDLCNETFIKNLTFDTVGGILSWTELDHDDLSKLEDLRDVVCDMELVPDDDVYYNEYEPVTTDERLLNLPFVYLDDRKGLTGAVQTMTYDYNNGILTLSLCGDDIVWQAQSHSI